MKNPLTPAGIEPATFRFVAQHLNHCATTVPQWWHKVLNRLTPNDPYMGRTAPLTSKRFILYIYSTNIGTEYFKHALYSPLFSLQNAVCFIMLICLVPVLFTFNIQSVLKLKKKSRRQKVKNCIFVYGTHLEQHAGDEKQRWMAERKDAVTPMWILSSNAVHNNREGCLAHQNTLSIPRTLQCLWDTELLPFVE